MILHAQKTHFEEEHGIHAKGSNAISSVSEYFDPSFRSMRWKGATHYFGSMQSEILRLLYDGAHRGEPWQNGKQMLHQVGSQSFTLTNVFQGKPVWKEIVESDGLGYYRLSHFLMHELTKG